MIDIFVADGELKKIKLDELAKHAGSKKKIWVDVTNPAKDEFKQLKEIFRIHPLTVEDCLKKGRTRVKIENFDHYLFIVIYGMPENSKRLYELDFIIRKNFVISNHFEAVDSFDRLKKNQDKVSTILSKGPDFILHKLIDLEIDRYMEVLAKYDDIIEHIERKILEEPNQQLISRIFRLRKKFMRIRRIAALQKEKLLELAREKHPFISERLHPYFRDVFDHMLSVTESVTTYRDQLSGALELSISTSSNKANEVMKTLTVIASIMLPLSLIAGLFGMNVRDIPFAEHRYAFEIVIGIMLAIAIGMLFYFKRRGWF